MTHERLEQIRGAVQDADGISLDNLDDLYVQRMELLAEVYRLRKILRRCDDTLVALRAYIGMVDMGFTPSDAEPKQEADNDSEN